MNVNDLCSTEERQLGYSSHLIGFGVLLYKNGLPFRQFATEEEMHEYIKEGKEDDEWSYFDQKMMVGFKMDQHVERVSK